MSQYRVRTAPPPGQGSFLPCAARARSFSDARMGSNKDNIAGRIDCRHCLLLTAQLKCENGLRRGGPPQYALGGVRETRNNVFFLLLFCRLIGWLLFPQPSVPLEELRTELVSGIMSILRKVISDRSRGTTSMSACFVEPSLHSAYSLIRAR